MKDLLFNPGTKSGLILRTLQRVFAAASLAGMVSTVNFFYVSAWSFLMQALAVHVSWCSVLACVDLGAWRMKMDPRTPALLCLFVLGDSSGSIAFWILWRVMHLIMSIWYFILGLMNTGESFLISSGFLKRYKTLDVSKVKYLAVVIDGEEALQTRNVLKLLWWLSSIGFENICLYDTEGVLKKSKQVFRQWLKSEKMSNEKHMNFEAISASDGKRAVTKAANFLLEKHYLGSNTEKPNLTETDMTDALSAIGYVGTEPDLMLIYGPARCHLGFPAWRIRYTEIVHIGSLQSMKLGSLIKSIHRFTTGHQNYGK